ncbi:heterokaryon incompatibility protein [Aspergillus luchuensis IFO 4308]|nr:heterokaryon incompatibility protein [Aspergillus luchuensis IFO 4308]
MAEECYEPEDAFSTTLVSDGKDEQTALLCDQCRGLELTVDKFIIEAGPSLIHMSTAQHYQPTKSEGKFRVKSGRNWEHFSTLQRLKERRQTCPLCDLIYRAINRYGKNIDDDTSCSLSWEVHGRAPQKSGKGFVNKTRRMKLSWGEISGSRREVYLMLVAPHDPLQPNSDASAKYRKGNHFLGRSLGDRKEKQALIKSWIDLCVKDHELCRDNHGSDGEFRNLIKQSYFGVVDVADMQLKSLPLKEDGSPEPYVALSYVWGQKVQDEPTYTTNRRTVMTHILHGGLETAWERLPRTIQDAMLLVSRLGYRYLWIDSLCIVQDSKSSWQLNASAMHLVYGNAQFTICAADGEDSSVGLRAVKPVLRTMRPVASPREAMASVFDPEDLNEVDSQPMNAECGPGVRLMVSRPLEAVIGDSIWSKRAWTFQERILSRRCLIFAEGRAYWQCREISISQDIHTDGRSKGLSLDPITSPLRTLQLLQSRPLWSYMSPNEMGSGEAIQHRALSAPSRGIQRLETDRREDGLIILRILGKADRQTFLKVIRPVPTRIPRGLRHRKVETPQDAILARIRQKAQRVQNLVSNLVENA